jgi:hypothetical protein
MAPPSLAARVLGLTLVLVCLSAAANAQDFTCKAPFDDAQILVDSFGSDWPGFVACPTSDASHPGCAQSNCAVGSVNCSLQFTNPRNGALAAQNNLAGVWALHTENYLYLRFDTHHAATSDPCQDPHAAFPQSQTLQVCFSLTPTGGLSTVQGCGGHRTQYTLNIYRNLQTALIKTPSCTAPSPGVMSAELRDCSIQYPGEQPGDACAVGGFGVIGNSARTDFRVAARFNGVLEVQIPKVLLSILRTNQQAVRTLSMRATLRSGGDSDAVAGNVTLASTCTPNPIPPPLCEAPLGDYLDSIMVMDGNGNEWPGSRPCSPSDPTHPDCPDSECVPGSPNCTLLLPGTRDTSLPSSLDLAAIWAAHSNKYVYIRVDVYHNDTHDACNDPHMALPTQVTMRFCFDVTGKAPKNNGQGCLGFPTDFTLTINRNVQQVIIPANRVPTCSNPSPGVMLGGLKDCLPRTPDEAPGTSCGTTGPNVASTQLGNLPVGARYGGVLEFRIAKELFRLNDTSSKSQTIGVVAFLTGGSTLADDSIVGNITLDYVCKPTPSPPPPECVPPNADAIEHTLLIDGVGIDWPGYRSCPSNDPNHPSCAQEKCTIGDRNCSLQLVGTKELDLPAHYDLSMLWATHSRDYVYFRVDTQHANTNDACQDPHFSLYAFQRVRMCISTTFAGPANAGQGCLGFPTDFTLTVSRFVDRSFVKVPTCADPSPGFVVGLLRNCHAGPSSGEACGTTGSAVIADSSKGEIWVAARYNGVLEVKIPKRLLGLENTQLLRQQTIGVVAFLTAGTTNADDSIMGNVTLHYDCPF